MKDISCKCIFNRRRFEVKTLMNKGLIVKKTTLSIILILISLIFAEKQLIVHNSDGTTAAFPLTNIDSLTIEEYQPKIGPFPNTWWIKYSVSSTGDNFQEEFSGSTYPARLYQHFSDDNSYGLQVKGTRGLGAFVSLKITYQATSEVSFGGLTPDYDFIRAARLEESPHSPKTVYVQFDDFNSSIDIHECQIFEFKFSDSEITGTFDLINMEVIQ